MSILDRLRRFLGLTVLSPSEAKTPPKLAPVPAFRGSQARPGVQKTSPSPKNQESKPERSPSVTPQASLSEPKHRPSPTTPPKGLPLGTKIGPDPSSKQPPPQTTSSSRVADESSPPLLARKPKTTLTIFAQEVHPPKNPTSSFNPLGTIIPAQGSLGDTQKLDQLPAPKPTISEPQQVGRPPRPFKLPRLGGFDPRLNPKLDEIDTKSENRSPNEPALKLVMGIDFGTSCSKVVVGDPTWRNRAYAIPLNDSPNIAGYLHPTRWENEANLKMRLIQTPNNPTVRDAAACYMADIINRTLDYFMKYGPAEYRNRELRWSLNIGFPRKSVTENTDLAKAYREITRVALTMWLNKTTPTIAQASLLRQKTGATNQFNPDSGIDIYPEIAAQLAGYIKSPYRKFGSLLLVDVGAGTLDVSTIIIHSIDEQDIVSFHFCEVEDLGILRLYQSRCQALENVQCGIVQTPLDFLKDASKAVPENLDQIVKTPTSRLVDAFNSTSNQFHQDVLVVTMRCLTKFRKAQKKNHINPAFEPWGRNLRFFLTGGGSRSMFYSKCLRDRNGLEQRVANAFTCWDQEESRRKNLNQGFRIERIPVPSNLHNFDQTLHNDFDRISVAYGLAYGDRNLMAVSSNSDT